MNKFMGTIRNPFEKQSNQDFTATTLDAGDDAGERSGEADATDDGDEELRRIEAQAREMQVKPI